MPLFHYLALTKEGGRSSGVINADSLEIAKEALRQKQILVTKISAYKAKSSRLSIPSAALLDFTRGMKILLRAKLPLYDALQILKEKHRQSKLHALFLDLSEQVKHGRHLSEALALYSKIFSPIYVAMVRAGEESGSLEISFNRLFDLLEKEHTLKKKLLSALMYPLFLSVFCLGVLAMLFFFLIPSMKGLLEERELHPMTEWILAISDALNTHTVPIFTTVGCCVLASVLFFRSKKGKKLIQKILYALPILQRVLTENLLSRFCRIFSLLLSCNIPLVESLKLSKQVIKQVTFEEAICQAEDAVISGGKLSEALGLAKGIPRLLTHMISIGEESGNLGEMVEHVAVIYEEDVDRSLLRLTSLLQPVMLLVMGVIVAVILLAVLLPLTDMSSLIQ